MLKTYTYAGWSLHNGEWRLRFANHVSRSQHLRRQGHEFIMMMPLPSDLTEYEAARHVFASNYIVGAPWRQYEPDGWESIDLLQGKYHVWWCEWCEQHPEIFYPKSVQTA